MFLYLIAALNILILLGILRVVREMRGGTYDEAELEAQLQGRGAMNRVFGRFTKTITKSWQMYPVGLLFGLGFDTATECWTPFSPRRGRCRLSPWRRD